MMGVLVEGKEIGIILLISIGLSISGEALIQSPAQLALREKLHLGNGIVSQSEGQSSSSAGTAEPPSTCSPVVNWTDHNCIIGPVLTETDIAPEVFHQLCQQRNGKFEAPASCDLYVVCHDKSLTVNRCPASFHFNPIEQICVDSQAYECSHPGVKDPKSILTQNSASDSLIREKRIVRSLLSEDFAMPSSKAQEIHSIGKRSPCKENYIQEHPRFCDKFLICSNGKTTVQECGPGTLFNPLAGVCDHPDNVDCKSRMADFGTYDCQEGHTYRTSHPEFCNKFVECEQSRLHIKTCPFNTVFNPETSICDHKNKYKCKELISLEHDTDINYLPSTIGRARQGRDLSKYVCEFNYIAPLEGVCNEFIECENKQMFQKSCGPGTAYNVLIGQCDWPYNVRVPDPQLCSKYLQCDGRKYVPKSCPQNQFFNVGTGRCEAIEHVSCAGKRDDPRARRPERPAFVGLQS